VRDHVAHNVLNPTFEHRAIARYVRIATARAMHGFPVIRAFIIRIMSDALDQRIKVNVFIA
jgi:hypothetical protein